MDATRSASLFAERMVIVEGISDAILVREFGRAWSAGDPAKQRFIDALTITVMGTKVGRWPLDLLASSGEEIVGRVAILTDTDSRGDASFIPPVWITDRDREIVRGFYSPPTLEPSITTGNEAIVAVALAQLGISHTPPLTADDVDDIFRNRGRKRKAEFSLEVAAEVARRLSENELVVVPAHFREMFDYLYSDES
jgi:putative ATP-dependent endonuclease of OLD family